MKLIRGILDLVMAGFLLVCMLLSVPNLWGYGIYTVTSGSMEPEIHTGDVIYTMPVEFQELREGDVITFSMNQGKTTVTHRIQKIDQKNRLIQTKGDANKENDRTWITEKSILGKVEYSIRSLGYLALLASSVSGKLFLLAVFMWMVAAQIAVAAIGAVCGRRETYVYQKKES